MRKDADVKSLLKSKTRVVAVDPGLSGAVCLLGRGRFAVERDFKDIDDLGEKITSLAILADAYVIEHVHAMPGEGVCSVWTFGKHTGAARALLGQMARPGREVVEVAPLAWKNHFKKQGHLLRGKDAGGKDDCRNLAREMFPDHQDLFKRVKDNNTADAVLLAVWFLQTRDL